MGKYIVKRLLLAAVTIFIILSLTFILMKLLPFQRPLGTLEVQRSYYLSQVADGFVVMFEREVPNNRYGECLFVYAPEGSKVSQYFYQTPIMTQYFSWLRNIFTQWNWGLSTYIQPNVRAIVIIGQF